LIRARIQAVWDIQRKRFSNKGSDIICNADMRVGEVRQFCRLQDDEGQSFMSAAMTQLNLSARAYHRRILNQLRIWRGVKKSNPRIWRRLCNTDRKA